MKELSVNEKMVSSQEQEVYKNVQEREFPYSTLFPGSLIFSPVTRPPLSFNGAGRWETLGTRLWLIKISCPWYFQAELNANHSEIKKSFLYKSWILLYTWRLTVACKDYCFLRNYHKSKCCPACRLSPSSKIVINCEKKWPRDILGTNCARISRGHFFSRYSFASRTWIWTKIMAILVVYPFCCHSQLNFKDIG